MNLYVLGFGFSPGPMEMMVVGMIALLLFGKRLPEVARSIGQGFREFKSGVSGIQSDVNHSVHTAGERSRPVPAEEQESEQITAPKFEPPTSAPAETVADSSSDSDKQDA